MSGTRSKEQPSRGAVRPGAMSAAQVLEHKATTPLDLNLRHLRALVEIVELGSMSAAALVLNLSQPALTQGIVKLESLIGQPLFERRPDGMRATAAGTLLALRAAAALEHLRASGKQLSSGDFRPERRVTMAQLRAFLALVKAGSFTAAAAYSGLSETSVHRAVRDLEAALGRQMVERRGRGIAVNFAGRRFARAGRLAVNEIRSAFSELGIDPQGHTIGVGTTPLARAHLAPEAMAMMAGSGEPLGFQVFEGSWGDLVELLRDGTLDVIIGELPPNESPDLLKIPLREESLVIVGGSQHPLAGQAHASLQTLAQYPWIIAPESSPLRFEWERLFAGRALPAAPVECGSIMIIGRLLTSTSMLTLATPDQVALQIRSGLLARVGEPLSESRYTIGVTLRSSWRPTSAQRRFLEMLEVAAAGAARRGGLTMAERWN